MDPWPHPEIPSPGMHIFGWMAPAELDWLHARAREMRTVVEVGSNRGRSAYALAKGTGENGGTLIAIDPWDDPGDHGYRAFVENLAPLGNVFPVRGRSPAIIAALAAKGHPLSSFPQAEMVFIDGDHEYDSVVADVEGWRPLTTRLLCGHDYVEGYQGVKQAVDELLPGAQVAPGTSIWYVEL